MDGTDATGERRTASDAEHWDLVHAGRPPEAASWYQPWPTMSLRMLDMLGSTVDDAIVDMGGGAGAFAAVLVERGHRDVTVVDVSAEALALARRRWDGGRVELVQAHVLEWRPARRYDVWHDRGVFHFLTTPEQRDRYRATLREALAPRGGVVIGAFSPDAPPSCSGLPVTRYDPAGLRGALGAGFTEIAHAREEHRTPRGLIQPFTWLALRRTD
jgi:SAM-dependent methyltransferase